MSERMDSPYECIDPAVGERLWRLDLPVLDDAERRALDAHVEACHACRLERELDAEARRLVREEPDNVIRPPRSRWLERVAALAVAAAAAGVLLLPPRPVGDALVTRGDDTARFERPVEGEVVGTGAELSWTEVEGAARYVVRVEAADGSSSWEAVVDDPALTIPPEAGLVAGRDYRARLAAEPSDVLPPGRVSVAFRTGGATERLAHRARHARPELQALGFGGLALLGLALMRRRLA